MAYEFDLVGVVAPLEFFDHQQRTERHPQRSKAYLGSYCCTLDGFIGATERVHHRPNWDWDQAVESIIAFWLSQGERVHHWKQVLDSTDGSDHLVVGRVVNYHCLRSEFEGLFDV